MTTFCACMVEEKLDMTLILKMAPVVWLFVVRCVGRCWGVIRDVCGVGVGGESWKEKMERKEMRGNRISTQKTRKQKSNKDQNMDY